MAVPPAGAPLVEYLIARLRETQIGARPPGHQAPPFDCQPLCWTQMQSAPGGAVDQTFNVRWTPEPDSTLAGPPFAESNASNMAGGVVAEPEEFPDDLVGVVWASCGVYTIPAAAATNAIFAARWTLFLNGSIVPGFMRQRPGGIVGLPGSQPGPPELLANQFMLEIRTRCPIILQQRDRMQVRFHWSDIPVGTVMFCAVIEGYSFPARTVSPRVDVVLTD